MNKDHVFKRRLLKLADFLDKLPRKRFDYSHWAGKDWGGKSDLSCGTTACALGWATTIPSLRKAGLRLAVNIIFGVPAVCLKRHLDNRYWVSLDTSAEAAREVFGLDYKEFETLFVPRQCEDDDFTPNPLVSNATPKQVANHIRKFVAKKYSTK